MQSEPPKGDPPKRKRRWFQFSLRSLMIGVTLLAVPLGYVGWQAKIVRHRRELIRQVVAAGSYVGFDFTLELEDSIPWLRRRLGDEAIRLFGLLGATGEKREEISAAFPEADVQIWLRPIEPAYHLLLRLPAVEDNAAMTGELWNGDSTTSLGVVCRKKGNANAQNFSWSSRGDRFDCNLANGQRSIH
jgi:hypothetical protein